MVVHNTQWHAVKVSSDRHSQMADRHLGQA